MKADESVLDFPKDGLCPSVWEKVIDSEGVDETWRMKRAVRDKLLWIAQAVCEHAKLDYSRTAVNVTGSITSNTYTSNADIDLHLHLQYSIREFAEMTQNRVKQAFKKVKDQYAAEGLAGNEGPEVDGHPVEVYYQPNEFQDMMSVGCYDVKTDTWTVGPELKDLSYNPYSELYQHIQAKAGQLLRGMRDKVLDVYEKAVVFSKIDAHGGTSQSSKDTVQAAFSSFRAALKSAVKLYEAARAMRKVYSSPESAEQALKYRSSMKWKIADAAFKLMDKFGYLAIMKKYAELLELVDTGDGALAAESATAVMSAVKTYISSPEKLADSEKLKEAVSKLAGKMKKLVESWQPAFDDKPVNQWGERWQKLKTTDWLYSLVDSAAKDCQTDLYDDGPKLERLSISSIHILKSRKLIVTLFGGANGGGMKGGCNLKYYLCLVRKLLEKLVGVCKPFEDAWLIDWDNDCADDVWTLRFVLKPSDETLAEIADCRYAVDQVKESINHDECMQYVDAFKDKLGYVAGYMPKRTIDHAANSLAHECALRMPTDTMAREIEGDAVILLVLSGEEEAVKAGKKLGDCMMKHGKHDKETLLKLMSDAYKAMTYLDAKRKSAKHKVAENAKDMPSGQQVDEGAKELLSTAAIAALLAVKGICPAASLETALKEVPKSEMRAASPAFKKAVAKATKGKSYNGMNITNIINCIARTIYAEAKGEGEEGQAAVASVIWNRAGGKCKNLVDVVLKDKQFSCWNEKKPGRTDKDYTLKIPAEALQPGKSKDIWDNCVELATKLATEEFTSTIGNRNSYMNKAKASAKAKREWGDKLDLKIGKHDFGYLRNNDGFLHSAKVPSIAKAQPREYIVRAGDTLSKIAKANGTTVLDLMKNNNLSDPDKVWIGQKLEV